MNNLKTMLDDIVSKFIDDFNEHKQCYPPKYKIERMKIPLIFELKMAIMYYNYAKTCQDKKLTIR
jgi:hypothetical protein